jgi:ATP-binding cassette, subfamily B, multidrug efflux pump
MLRRLGYLVDPFSTPDIGKPAADVREYVLQHLRPFRAVIVASLAFSVVSAGLEVWLIWYAGQLVDALAATSTDDFWQEHGTELVAVAALLLILRPLAFLAREGLNDLAFRPNAIALFRWNAHQHVARQSVGWFQNDFAGRTASRVRDIGISATGAAYTVLHTLAYVIIYMIGSAWLLMSIDLRLVLPLVVWVLLYVGLMIYTVPRFRDRSEAYQEATSALTGVLVDTYSNMDVIKSFADSDIADADVREQIQRTRAAQIDLQRIEVTINGGMTALGTLLTVGLVGYTVVLWQAGNAPIGIVAAALALTFRIHGMAEWMLDAVASLFGYAGATHEALKTVAQPIDIVDSPDAVNLVQVAGAVRFDQVSHHYGKGDGGLDRVSIDIRPGERIGLVGPSGVGKSTLVNLLLRFFDTETGRIELDGTDIRTVTQDSLRRQIAIVSQNTSLLNRSVRDNIAFGRRDVSQVSVESAARQAAAHEFIAGLRDHEGRDGYDAHVGERGIKLSGGQRQRIALARAILKDAPILVLDEATSALDSDVESGILDTLYAVMEGKTVIAIAHRLSTIARMDRIVVLQEGHVAEQGTHADLIQQQGIYAGLWERQAGGFLGH